MSTIAEPKSTASPTGVAEAEIPPLPPPPVMHGAARSISAASRVVFKYGNRYAMVPFHRAGLGAWLGNPLSGWQCLLTTTGRRTGLQRPTPLGYLVADGAAWVLAGYGPATLWYRNILEETRTTLLLPGRPPLATLATEVRDPGVRARIIPSLARSMALPGTMIGCFPPTSTDERILELLTWVPLVRIAAADGTSLAAGPDDPGGLGWTWRQALAIGATVLALRLLGRALRR